MMPFTLPCPIAMAHSRDLPRLPQGNGNMEDGELASRGGYPYTFPPLAQRGTSKAFHSTADTRCACRSEMSEHIRRVRAVTKPS